jgi:acetyl-CoA acetyltransferase
MATAGVEPRIMGIGPAPATQKLLRQLGMTLEQFDVIELNEAFASQGLAVLRTLGLRDDDPRVNPNGGAIALGHPLGASGARLITTALFQLERINELVRTSLIAGSTPSGAIMARATTFREGGCHGQDYSCWRGSGEERDADSCGRQRRTRRST